MTTMLTLPAGLGPIQPVRVGTILESWDSYNRYRFPALTLFNDPSDRELLTVSYSANCGQICYDHCYNHGMLRYRLGIQAPKEFFDYLVRIIRCMTRDEARRLKKDLFGG